MENIKKVCLILITISVVVFLGFQVWSISEKQRYFRIEECKDRYEVSWNYESDKCEKIEYKPGNTSSNKIEEFLRNR